MNSAFNSEGLQYAWDSTSIKLAETCHYKYKLRMIDRWEPKRKSAHLLFGSWYASALERYYKYRAEAGPMDTSDRALLRTVHEALCDTWIDDKPWTSDHPAKTRENLIRSIIWYVDQFKDEATEVMRLADGKPAVEHSFTLPVDNGIVFAGHIDRLVTYAGDPYIMDQKTTGGAIGPWYFDNFTPDTQMSMYTFAGQMIYKMPVKGVILDVAQIAVGFSRFERGFAFRSEGQLHEWYDSTMRHIEEVQENTRRNHFPLRTTSCGLYGGCEFRAICSRSPEVREKFLEGDYQRGPQWNPLESR
jgi:hypothetical protein